MALLPNENEWDTRYDKFLVLGSWLGAVYYAVPVAIILAVCRYTQVAEELWIPVLIIYFIGALAHQLNHGSMALNIQIKGAYILSLTDRFAGCRGPVLVAMRSPKSGFSGHGPLCYVRTD